MHHGARSARTFKAAYAIDSFISGFELAWKLSTELNNYENERSVSCRMVKKLGARFASQKEEEK